MKLLLVDDDKRLISFVTRGLSEHGHEVHAAADVPEAWVLVELRRPGEFDLILLDVMLPGPSGWDFLEELRQRGIQTPVIFLTGRHSVEERVRGLEAGADDYVVKPFALSELLARIQAVQRRHMGSRELSVGDLRIDLIRRRVTRGGRSIELSPKEFDLLIALVESRGLISSRDKLLKAVWGIDFDPGTNLVAATIARLRRKVDGSGVALIQTVLNKGYRLVADGTQ